MYAFYEAASGVEIDSAFPSRRALPAIKVLRDRNGRENC